MHDFRVYAGHISRLRILNEMLYGDTVVIQGSDFSAAHQYSVNSNNSDQLIRTYHLYNYYNSYFGNGAYIHTYAANNSLSSRAPDDQVYRRYIMNNLRYIDNASLYAGILKYHTAHPYAHFDKYIAHLKSTHHEAMNQDHFT
jgi:hypothetical protein